MFTINEQENKYSRQEVIGFIKPKTSPWNGFENFRFIFKILSIDEVINNFRTCRKERDTFIKTGKVLLDGKLEEDMDYINEVIQLAENYEYRGPMLITNFIHSDLQKIWPDTYPKNSKIPPTDIIVEDGNHRLLALTIKLLKKENVPYNSVGVFIGRIF